jgi:hypothetical protein
LRKQCFLRAASLDAEVLVYIRPASEQNILAPEHGLPANTAAEMEAALGQVSAANATLNFVCHAIS